MFKKGCLILGILLIFVSVSFAGSLFNEGLWEITSKMEIPGMPVPMPPITYTQCMTNQDPVPNQSDSGQECRMKNVKTKGHTVSWEMVCDSQQGEVKSSGKVTYKGERLDGVVMMDIPGQGKMKMTMTGQRIGKCKK